jgi:hypothetical protein
MQTQTAIARAIPSTDPIFQRIWPPVAIACGVGLTAGWVALLGYGAFKVVELAF